MKIVVSHYVSDGEIEYNVGREIEITPGVILSSKVLGKPGPSVKLILLKCPVCGLERFTPLYCYKKSLEKDKLLCKVCNGTKQGKINSKKYNRIS